ncbi:MAG: M56 family metallopeptidase, partial [Tepidisphaeraceae bacterium]
MLVLPRELMATIDAEQRAAVLIHELAHLRRGDHWVRLVEIAATAALWWHPLLWLARLRLTEAEEQCCDAWVVALLPHARRRYADALVDALEQVCVTPLPVLATGLGRLSTLRRRITMILQHSPRKSLSRVARVALAGALLAFAVSPVPGVANDGVENRAPAPSASAPTATAPADDATRKAVVALFEAAQDQNSLVNEAARQAILQFGPKAAPVLIEALAAEATTPVAVQLLSQMGEPGLAPLAGALRAKAASVRLGALQAIEAMMSPGASRFGGGEMGMEGAMAGFGGSGAVAVTWDFSPEIVDAAKRCMDAVAELVSDPETPVREAAARVLGQTGGFHESERAAKVLMAALKDPEVKVRTAAANALLYLAPAKPDTAAALAEALGDADPGMRLAVLQVLWRMGPAAKPAMAAVTAALRDETPAIRAMAAQALGAMQARAEARQPVAPGGFAPGGFGAPPAQ